MCTAEKFQLKCVQRVASRTNELHYTAHLQQQLHELINDCLGVVSRFQGQFLRGGAFSTTVSMIRKDDTALCSGQLQLGTIHAAPHIVPGHTNHTTATGGPHIRQPQAILPSSVARPLWNVQQTKLVGAQLGWPIAYMKNYILSEMINSKVGILRTRKSISHFTNGGLTH